MDNGVNKSGEEEKSPACSPRKRSRYSNLHEEAQTAWIVQSTRPVEHDTERQRDSVRKNDSRGVVNQDTWAPPKRETGQGSCACRPSRGEKRSLRIECCPTDEILFRPGEHLRRGIENKRHETNTPGVCEARRQGRESQTSKECQKPWNGIQLWVEFNCEKVMAELGVVERKELIRTGLKDTEQLQWESEEWESWEKWIAEARERVPS